MRAIQLTKSKVDNDKEYCLDFNLIESINFHDYDLLDVSSKKEAQFATVKLINGSNFGFYSTEKTGIENYQALKKLVNESLISRGKKHWEKISYNQ